MQILLTFVIICLIHLFVLGTVVFLLIAIFSHITDLSKQKTFKYFFRLYNIRLPFMTIMFLVRGITQVLDMLEKAFNKIPDNTNLILHSDQGWQYQMKQYQALLKEKGIRQSMSRKGNCLDNSLAENFFGLLKSELFYMKEYKTIEELEKDIIEYIDYYNNKRIKGKLKGMSPVQYRVHSQAA